jgi:hypothetical protein
MIKRFLIFVVVLGVALAGLYVWWQRNATQIITREIRAQASGFFTNSSALDVSNDPVKMTGLRTAHVPQVVVKGTDLRLREGGELASAKIVLKDIDVAGPPFRLSRVGDGYFVVTVTDDAVTDYIRERGVRVTAVARIPMDTVTVNFTKAATQLRGEVKVPLIRKQVPIIATGQLLPSSASGQVDFRVRNLQITKYSLNVKQLTEAIEHLNPVIDLSEWPVQTTVTKVQTGNGTVTITGRVHGIQRSLFP